MSAAWDNGTHAHWNIEDNPGPKVYSKRFNHTEQMAGPGLKDVLLVVHNVNDTLVLCQDDEKIYCGAGTTTGKDVDVIFDVKNVLQMGTSRMRIIAVPYKDLDFVGLFVYTDSSITLSNPVLQGNMSEAGLSGPIRRIYDNKSYSLYTITTAMQANKNISLTYNMLPSVAGRYTFVTVANYSGQSDSFTKTVDFSSCADTNPIVAQDSSGNCKSFPTICDLPKGWNVAERCATPVEKPVPEGSPAGGVIVVLIIIIVLAIGYRYRDRIREKLKRKKQTFPEIKFDDESTRKFDGTEDVE